LFAFANFLLLALFAAAAADLLSACRAQGCRAALGWLWRTPHPLFGSRAERWGSPLFAAGLAAYECSVVFCHSMARENWPWVLQTAYPALQWAAFICFGAKILLCTRYTWRELTVAGALYFIARWVYFNNQSIWFIGIAVAVLAAKDADLTKALRAFLAAGIFCMASVMALYFTGILDAAAASERDGAYRFLFGYGHPNTLGGMILGLVLAWVLLHRAAPRRVDAAVCLTAAAFLWFGPACRSAALTCFLLGAGLLLCKTLPRAAAPCAAALVAALGAVSYILPLFVVKIGPWNDEIGPAWLAKLDGLLTCRISNSWSAYRLLPVKIAGQILPEWPVLDNIYLYALYALGPVMAALLAGLLAASLWKYARRGAVVPFLCLLAVLFYAVSENQVLHLTTNPAALLLCGAVYGHSINK